MFEKMEAMYAANEEWLAQHTIGMDDTFRFHCTECGKCCQHRDEIILTPYDLNRIARHLGITIVDVVKNYCICYIGWSSKLPVVALKMEGRKRKCPFLEKQKCKIHEVKPSVCALYPLGRVASEDGESVRYVLQNVNCGSEEEEYTVRKWLSRCGFENNEEWFQEWSHTIISLSTYMRAIAAITTEKGLAMLAQFLHNVLYFNYENDQDFLEQFRQNAQVASTMLHKMAEDLAEGLKDEF